MSGGGFESGLRGGNPEMLRSKAPTLNAVRKLMDLFEWDKNKAQSNFIKHGVSFEEAECDRLLLVSYTERGNRIRIISARPCTSQEARLYDPS